MNASTEADSADRGSSAPVERTALVLAGGGTKGAFEVGALEHLLVARGVEPGIITSTSAGSILGSVLAQARGATEIRAAVDDLRTDLLAMTRTAAVFGRQPWLEAFDGTPFGDAVESFVSNRTRPPVPGGEPDPDAANGQGTPERRTHSNWQRFTTVLSELPAAARARKDLEGHMGSILTLDPLEAALRGHSDSGFRPVDPSRIVRPGLELRMTVTALVAGESHYICGDGTVMGPDAVTPVGHSAVDAIEGALASSTVPMVFAPRPIGPEVYVDGGCLQNIPVEAAVALGAEDLYAVVAAPIDPQPATADFTRMNFVGIYLRTSAEIGFTDTQRSNLRTPLPDGARLHVIAPTIDVVSPFEVQQGLMLLDMDYGRMRAQEALADITEDDRRRAMAATDSIVVARERAWYLEQACIDDGSVSSARVEALRGMKAGVVGGLSTRAQLGFAAPEGAERWASCVEHHDGEAPAALSDAIG